MSIFIAEHIGTIIVGLAVATWALWRLSKAGDLITTELDRLEQARDITGRVQ
jgi:hypothetical protein